MDPVALLGWMALGLVAGAIARATVPSGEPLGRLTAMLLGVVGAFVGGLFACALRLGTAPYEPAGWLFASAGAGAALTCYHWASGKSFRA